MEGFWLGGEGEVEVFCEGRVDGRVGGAEEEGGLVLGGDWGEGFGEFSARGGGRGEEVADVEAGLELVVSFGRVVEACLDVRRCSCNGVQGRTP